MNPRFAVFPLLLALSLPLSAATILDDHFTGTTLDTDVWEYHPWSTGTVSLHDSRIDFEPGAIIEAYNTGSLNYVNIDVYGVQGTGFSFGFSAALGGWIDLSIGLDHDSWLSVGPFEDDQIPLGLTSNGVFEIIWTPTLLQVVNNGELLFSTNYPAQIPYYEQMGAFIFYTGDDGSLSLDHVVLTIPEPATLSMLSLSLFLLRFSFRRRKP